MDYDDIRVKTRVASDQESDALDAALGLKKVEFRVSEDTYDLLKQLAIHNGVSLPHLLRTIIEQRLKI
jgi:hypothetical protein